MIRHAMTADQWAQHITECREPWRLRQFPYFELVTTASCANALPWTMAWQAAGGHLSAGRMVAPKGHPIWTELDLPHDDVELLEVVG
jgi:hypothetical protein